MGYPTGEVDIPTLNKVGAAIQQASTSFEKAYSSHAGQLAPAGTLHEWGTGGVLAHAGESWSNFIRNFAGQVHDHGAAMSRAAKAYEAADSGAANRFGGVSTGHPFVGSRP